MEKLRALWTGELALGDAFWTWAVLGGLLVNISTSVLFIVLIMLEHAWAALIIGYGFSIPYNLVVVVGVWRSAARYFGPRSHADLARGATVVLMTVLSLT